MSNLGYDSAFNFPGSLAQSVEHLTFNQVVAGSIPARPTIWNKDLREIVVLFLCLVITALDEEVKWQK